MELNKIYNQDCLLGMKDIPDKSIDGIITSPPYNINTERSDCYYNNGYSEIDNLTEENYLNVRVTEFKEFSRIMKNKSAICYNISYAKENPILPTLLITKVHNETDLTVADIICWKKPHSIPFQTSPTKLSRITELIYVIVKKNELHTFITNKEVSKINAKTGQAFYKNYCNYIEARNNDGYKCSLKASYSQELCVKLIDVYFPKCSFILDPFMGIGTTAIACINTNRNYIGYENNEEYYNISQERIQKHTAQIHL